jgi:hypothetical protein
MKSFLVCVLLMLVPLSSLRMVCLAGDGSARPAITPEAAADADHECERICMRRPVAPPHASTVTCLLIADPGCTFLDTGTVAIMPREPVIPASRVAGPFEPIAADDYLPPTLARRSPPPKA